MSTPVVQNPTGFTKIVNKWCQKIWKIWEIRIEIWSWNVKNVSKRWLWATSGHARYLRFGALGNEWATSGHAPQLRFGRNYRKGTKKIIILFNSNKQNGRYGACPLVAQSLPRARNRRYGACPLVAQSNHFDTKNAFRGDILILISEKNWFFPIFWSTSYPNYRNRRLVWQILLISATDLSSIDPAPAIVFCVVTKIDPLDPLSTLSVPHDQKCEKWRV